MTSRLNVHKPTSGGPIPIVSNFTSESASADTGHHSFDDVAVKAVDGILGQRLQRAQPAHKVRPDGFCAPNNNSKGIALFKSGKLMLYERIVARDLHTN